MTAQNAIINCVLAPLALIGMFALGAAIDAAPDSREETANAISLQDAQQQAAIEQRAEQAARAMCVSVHGPNVQASWTPEGAVICTPKRGPANVLTAQSAIK
jgi:UrcA family protein